MFGGSSQLSTTAEGMVMKSNHLDNIVESWEEPAEHLIDSSEKTYLSVGL